MTKIGIFNTIFGRLIKYLWSGVSLRLHELCRIKLTLTTRSYLSTNKFFAVKLCVMLIEFINLIRRIACLMFYIGPSRGET